MKNLSPKIEKALNVIIEGLGHEPEIDLLNSEKVKASIESKAESFKYTKELLEKWQHSPNAPTKSKLQNYIRKILRAGDNSLKVLGDALEADIDFEKVKPEKHKLAIQAKPVILKGIHTIEAGLIELRHQLESGHFNFADREFKIGYPEKFALGEFYPKENYFKDWYQPFKDAVKICPFGTEGKTIVLDDLKIILPGAPVNKKEILFWDLPKEEQYWRRTLPPGGLTKETHEQYIEYILEEFRRRREGIWFMNNGIPVYLTGDHYFALQWCKMKDNGGYMNFRYAQTNMFYFTKACIVDDRCLGEIFVKSRRTGFTFEILFTLLNHATGNTNGMYGMTSKSDPDASKAFSKLSYAFLNLPFFFRPVVKGRVDSPIKLEFAKPSDGSKEAKKKGDTHTDDYLNNIIDYEATKDDAYDGQAMTLYLGDECGKWKKPANYLNHWGQISPTFDEGGSIVGKAFLGSTVAARKKGGEEFKILEESSRINKRDSITNRTPSGLYSYFLPAHKNLREFTDIYGVCHEKTPPKGTRNADGKLITTGSIDFLNARRASKKAESLISYNEELRAFPMEKSEAFRDELSQAIFDTNKIEEQILHNENLPNLPYVRGNFIWSDKRFESEVLWAPNPDGRFYISWLPLPENRNKKEFKNGQWHPLNGHIGAGGVDSFDNDVVADPSRASSGALHFCNRFSMTGAPMGFVLEYIERTPYAEMFYEDVLMAAIFYGYPLLIENIKRRIIDKIKEWGYYGYIMQKPKVLKAPSSKKRKEDGIGASAEEMSAQEHVTQHYIYKNVGYNDETGEMGGMPFNRTLVQWRDYKPKERTAFDAYISSSTALLAIQSPVVEKKNKKKSTMPWIQYRKQGNTSVRV